MSSFGGIIFTDRGRNLQAKAQAGAQLQFTRIAVGDGQLGTSAIKDLTALKNQVLSLNITKLKTLSGGKAVVGTVLSNQGLATGFYWREVGVFAQDPDLGEILYCYGNAGASAEYIPADGGTDLVEKSIDVITIIGNTANVTATIDQSLIYATQQDIGNLSALSTTEKTNLVGAINEAFQFANDGKTSIATVVGSPALSGDTFTQLKDKIQAVKNTIASNLIAKGVAAVATEALAALADKIANIVRGSGTALPGDVRKSKTFTNDTGELQTGTLDLTNLVSGNIRAGVTIDGVQGKASVVDTADANATQDFIVAGKSAYANGVKHNGGIPLLGSEEYPGWRRASYSYASVAGRLHLRIPLGAYLTGAPNQGGQLGVFYDDPNFSPVNIKYGVTMLGLTGTGPKYAPTEYIPGTSMTGLITNLHWDLATTPYCIHVDKAGYIYVGSNAKISKYHPGDKSLVWEYILPNNIAAQEMVTDSAGNLYAGLGNFILLKLNPSGGKVWEVTMPYIPKKVTVDSSDWVWVHAYRVYRYDPNGNLATTADVVQANDYVDINWHPSGHIYLAMQYWHYFINPYNNTKVYEAYINYPCVGAKIKDEYQLIVCNTSNASGIRFYKYHQCATKIFELNIHPRGTADGTTYGMGADSQGNVYVASYLNLTGAASQYYLQKVSYDGAHQWGFNPTSPIHKICLDELNGALVCQAIDHALVKRFHHVHQIIK